MVLRRQLKARKRRIKTRLEAAASGEQKPEIKAANIHYEISERQQAVACGGIGLMHQMVKRLELDKAINEYVNPFKLYLPYADSDHGLNIAHNTCAGRTRLEHFELGRNDEAFQPASRSRTSSYHGDTLLVIDVAGFGSTNGDEELERQPVNGRELPRGHAASARYANCFPLNLPSAGMFPWTDMRTAAPELPKRAAVGHGYDGIVRKHLSREEGRALDCRWEKGQYFPPFPVRRGQVMTPEIARRSLFCLALTTTKGRCQHRQRGVADSQVRGPTND